MIDGTNAKRYGTGVLVAEESRDEANERGEDSHTLHMMASAYRAAATEDRADLLAGLRDLHGHLGEWIADLERDLVPSLPLPLEPAETRREWSLRRPEDSNGYADQFPGSDY